MGNNRSQWHATVLFQNMGDNYKEWMQNTLNLETDDWKREGEPELDNEGCFHTSAPKIIYQVPMLNFFTAVVYCHSMVMQSFCVIKQHNLGNYCRMAVNYCGICVTNVTKHDLT